LQLHGARLRGISAQEPPAFQVGELCVDARAGRQADRLADLPDGRRVAPLPDGVLDVVQDPSLPARHVVHAAPPARLRTLTRSLGRIKHLFDSMLTAERTFGI